MRFTGIPHRQNLFAMPIKSENMPLVTFFAGSANAARESPGKCRLPPLRRAGMYGPGRNVHIPVRPTHIAADFPTGGFGTHHFRRAAKRFAGCMPKGPRPKVHDEITLPNSMNRTSRQTCRKLGLFYFMGSGAHRGSVRPHPRY